MKNLSIILACILVAMVSCTKSKEVHPEIGDGNDEIVTVGMKDVHVEYTRTDHAELNRVVFHYSPADANGNAQQFVAAEMTKKETFFELVLDDLLCDTLYWYYYELFPNSGDAFNSVQKTFHTQAYEQPGPPTPPVAELPTVVTGEVSEITTNSAQCAGEVTSDGGAEVTERGICWGTNANPTISNSHSSAGTGVGTFSATMGGLSANTTYHVRAYATNEAGTAYGSDKEFITIEGGGVGDHEWVDLGLPSGLLWATCNVGTDTPEGRGDPFAWGETTTKSTFTWSAYRYCNGSNHTLTKYCNNSSYGNNGFTDNLTTLQLSDDAARANWGGDWRMPTKAEWEELKNNTITTWTTQNGVYGIKFTSSNGNSLFLPAGSHGEYTFYWSSSLFYTGYPDCAWVFFNSSYCDITDSARYCGYYVRAVRSAKKK